MYMPTYKAEQDNKQFLPF